MDRDEGGTETTPLDRADPEAVAVEIPVPDDWHVHLRDDAMLEAVVAHSARRFRYGLVMPNLRPPVTTGAQAAAYRDRILAARPAGAERFTPLMTLFASPDLDLDDVRAAHAAGIVVAVKYYPPGATTNADQARGTLAELDDLLEILTATGMRLLVHAESTDPRIDIFDREAAFLVDELAPVCARHPELGVTVEHVSTAAGVDFVRSHPGVVASVTPHHLARDRSHLLADGLHPDLYCKPVINSGADRRALVAAVASGDPSFFLGTDSAPHATTAKYGPKGAAGVFGAPHALEVVAEVFHEAGALDRLAGFVSHHGAAVYGVDPAADRLVLTRSAPAGEPVRRVVTSDGDEVVVFGVDEAGRWRIDEI